MDIHIEQRYEKLVNFITDYIYTVKIKDGKAVETYHGPGCVNVTGYTSEDYEKSPKLWHAMVHKEDSEKVLKQAELARNGQDVESIEHRIIHRNGSIRWVKNSIVITRDEHGTPIYYDGLINDITELKRAEEEAMIHQQQLIQADKMASLGILIAGIAHEINNPNNFILLNAQFFQKVWDDVQHILEEYYKHNGDFVIGGMIYSRASQKINQSLEGILNGSTRIREIVGNLTDYARTDSGKLDEDVDINRVIEMSITITRNLIKRSTNNFRVSYDHNIPTIKGNNQQLEQVIINLISNACHSLDDSDKLISITTSYSEEDNIVEVEVADEGIGIDEKDLKYIMDPFFTTKRSEGGTGLGLSISYNIVKKHKGNLELFSKAAKGTHAVVTLPIKRED